MHPKRWALAPKWILAALVVAGLAHPSWGDDKAKTLAEQLEGQPPEEKVRLLKTMVDGGEGTKETYFYLGNAYYESNDLNRAIQAFEQALAIDPAYFKAAVNLALMYDEQERYPKAIEVFERAAEIEPENPDVWSHMGNTYYAQSNYPKAMDLYQKALDLDAKATHALYSIGVAFADAGIFREAVRYWTQVSQLEPESELGRSAAENVELLNKYLIPH